MSLTLRSYLLVALIISIGIIGQWADPALQDIWRYLVAMVILLLLYEGWRAKQHNHQLRIHTDIYLHLGKATNTRLEFINQGPYRLITQLQPAHSPQLNMDRQSHQLITSTGSSSEIQLSIIPQQLGQFNWMTFYSRSRGFLGLAWWNRQFQPEQTLEIIPDRIYEHEYRSSMVPQGSRQQLSSGQGMEYIGLREYSHGDPLNIIDWKATARKNQPVSRIFTEEQHLEIFLLIDCGFASQLQAGSLSRVNQYINIAARLSQQAIQNGDRVSVISYASSIMANLPMSHGTSGLRKIRDTLAGIRALPSESNALTAVMHLRRQLQRRSLVVLFTDLESAESDQQLLRSIQMLRPKHLPLLVSVLDEDIEAMTRQPARDWLSPYQSYAAQEITLTSKKLARQLQRLGCHLVHQREKYIDQAVLDYYGQIRNKV